MQKGILGCNVYNIMGGKKRKKKKKERQRYFYGVG